MPPIAVTALAAMSLGHSFGAKPVLQDINLTLGKGDIVVVLGPSGCGKSTLLRLLAGLIQPDTGQVILNGAAPRPGKGNSIVFQNYRLLPWKSVRENLAFALPDLSGTARNERVDQVLRLVGLSRFADVWPAELSGGMKQRAALARALAPQPDFLLMDEPFAALDAQARELMQEELRQLVGRPDGPGVVFVTHSVDEALVLGHRIIVLSPRPGRVVTQITTPVWGGDPREHEAYAVLRRRLWEQLRDSVLNDPSSDFYALQSFSADRDSTKPE